MSERICFVIAPIGDPESDIRKRSDQILKHLIAPAAFERGFKAVRADKISEPGMITSKVIQHIVDDPLVIADLTGWNPNVFYELAIRHALRKPFVQLIQTGERLPFDVAGLNTIHVDHRDLDSVALAKTELIAQIDALEKDSSKVETPISITLDVQSLRQSGKPEERSIAEVFSAINELRVNLLGLSRLMEQSAKVTAALVSQTAEVNQERIVGNDELTTFLGLMNNEKWTPVITRAVKRALASGTFGKATLLTERENPDDIWAAGQPPESDKQKPDDK